MIQDHKTEFCNHKAFKVLISQKEFQYSLELLTKKGISSIHALELLLYQFALPIYRKYCKQMEPKHEL